MSHHSLSTGSTQPEQDPILRVPSKVQSEKGDLTVSIPRSCILADLSRVAACATDAINSGVSVSVNKPQDGDAGKRGRLHAIGRA